MIILVCDNNSVAIKKGKREGTILLAHKISPFFAADILLEEKSNSPSINSIKVIDNIRFQLHFINYI